MCMTLLIVLRHYITCLYHVLCWYFLLSCLFNPVDIIIIASVISEHVADHKIWNHWKFQLWDLFFYF